MNPSSRKETTTNRPLLPRPCHGQSFKAFKSCDSPLVCWQHSPHQCLAGHNGYQMSSK